MKADQQTTEAVTATLKAMFEAYSNRDLEGYLAFWAPDSDIFALGSGADEKSLGTMEISENVKRDWAQSEEAKAKLGKVAVSAAGSVSWFATDVTIDGLIGKETFTGVLEKRNGKWLMAQMHLSLPSCGQAQGQSWPQP